MATDGVCQAGYDSAITFKAGEKFSSVEEFEMKLEAYKKQAFVEFWRRDSRTITAARKRGVDRPLKADLKYYDLKYCCVHGGRAFKPRGKGSRCTSTFKQDCPAHISLKIDKNGTAFEVGSICTEHNHEISQELFKHLPRQRSLPTESKEKAAKLLKMNVNKKLLQQELVKDTGNVILLKDLTNIESASKRGRSRNDLDVTVDTLTKRYGASVEIYCDSEKNLKGIFFQDQQMKDAFKAYPELLCVDATYKLLLGLPVYLMLCEDSNGQSEIVAVCLLVTEDSDSMTWMMEAFKKHNADWEHVRVVMADKDIGERDVIKQQLPHAAVLICLFHTLRSLRREITCEKMGISSGQRSLCLEMMQKMAYATSENHYSDLHAEFVKSAPKEVVSYFDENWHGIRNEWVLGMKSSCGNFLNFTNNRLESINGKLKQVVNRHSSLEEFIEKFFVILTALRTERDHKAALVFQKVKVNPFRDDSPQSMYSRLLTNYAADFVHKQLELAGKVSSITSEGDKYTVKTSEGQKSVTLSNCECIFSRSMLLPCRHIFALRSQQGLSLFDAALCHERWTSAYYRSTQRLFMAHSSEQESTMILTTSKKHRRSLSQHQKFRMASIVTAELASVASYASKAQFDRRIKLLKELTTYWKNGEEVGLAEVNESDLSEGSSNSSESDDHPKSIVVKPSVNKCHPTAHKDGCPRSELSHDVGSASGVIKLMDDNKVSSDLSKGCSSDDLVCGDKPGDPKSSVFKTSRNPDTTADKNGRVVDKNHCPQSESSCERVGSTSRDATKLMDDNHVQKSNDLSDSRSDCSETDELPGKPKSLILRKSEGIAAKKDYPTTDKDYCPQSESSQHVGNPKFNGDATKLMDDNQIEMRSDLSEGLESDNEPKSKVHKTSRNPEMTTRLTADKDPKPNADESGVVAPAKVKEDSTEKSQTTTSLRVLNENTGKLQQGSLGIKVAPIVKRRGRPRGHELTSIGLPAKKAKKDVDKKPCSFSRLHVSAKEEVMLLWFVDKKVAELALKQAVLIVEEHVECRPEWITDAVIDENVDIHLIRKYFAYDAWLLVEQVLMRKRKKMTWICKVCHQDLHAKTSGPSIICESCLLWYHFACVGLSKQPKTKNWFCRSCYASSKSDSKI